MAQQNTLGGDLQGADSSKEGVRVDLSQGYSDSSSQRPLVPAASHPPTTSTASGACATRPVPPRNVSQQYNRICTTHKKLVKSGAVQCSVSLSDTPTTVNLPSAPSSPAPDSPQLGASVHWGVVGDFSGVQTPFVTPASSPTRPSVIIPVPHTLQPTRPIVAQPLAPPPRQQILPSPTLVEGVAALLQDQLPDYPDYPASSRPAATRSMLSSTDPNILQESYFPVAGSNSSLESTEVFSPVQNQNQSSNIMAQQQLNMGEASRNLHKLRNRLNRAMEISLTADLVTLQRVPVIEEELASIKVMRDDYQDAIEDYLLDFSSELEQDPAGQNRTSLLLVERLSIMPMRSELRRKACVQHHSCRRWTEVLWSITSPTWSFSSSA